jgi:hypothetical protein
MKSRRPFSVISVIKVTGVFILTAFFAFVGFNNLAVAGNCEDLLDNNAYRCFFKGADEVYGDVNGYEFETCVQFVSPGMYSQHFDAYLYPAAEYFESMPMEVVPMACECKAGGSFRNPKFHASNWFHCVSVCEEVGYGFSVEGKVIKRGNKIIKGQMVDESGYSYVFKCVLDPECSTPGMTRATKD